MSTPKQATPYVPLTMYCQNPECAQPIPLPGPKHQAQYASLPTWSKDDWKQAFLCSQCGHAHVYSEQNVRLSLEGTDSPRPKVNLFYCIDYECAAVGCGFPTKLYVVTGADVGITTLYEKVSSFSRLHFPCGLKKVPHSSRLPKYPPPVEPNFLFSF
jgi:hypothetical protein